MNRLLIHAARTGDADTVAAVLALGADIHYGNDWALRLAVVFNRRNVVELLLVRGGGTPSEALLVASQFGMTNIVELLLDRGADVHADDDRALHDAAMNGDLDMASVLLNRGANVNAKGDRALQAAIHYEKRLMVILLLRRGADPAKIPDWYMMSEPELRVVRAFPNWQNRKRLALWMAASRSLERGVRLNVTH
jgi:ankyrin repeat protein